MPPKKLTPPSLTQDERDLLDVMRRVQGKRFQRAEPRTTQPQTKPYVGQWFCKHNDCVYAVKGKPNWATRKDCNGCFRPKNRAVNPPLALSIPPAEPTTRREPAAPKAMDTRAKKVMEAEAKKAMERPVAAQPSQPASLIEETFGTFKAPAKPKPVVLHGDTEADKIGVHPLQDFDVEALYYGPPDNPQPLTSADELVSKLLPIASSQALAGKEQGIEITKAILAQCPEWHPGHNQTVELLKTQEAEYSKLKRQAPCPKVYIEQLRSAWQGQKQSMTQWQETVAKGKSKADDRLKAHLKAIDDLSRALIERRTAVITAHTNTTRAWEAFNSKRLAQWKSVLAQLDAKVSAAEASAASAQTALVGAMSIVDAARVPVPVEASMKDALEEAKRDAVEAQRKIAEMQLLCDQHQAASSAAVQVVARLANEADNALRFTCSTEDLPTMIPEPEPAQWESYHALYAALEKLSLLEATSGEPVPVTFEQLGCGLDVPRLLLGTVWNKAFPGAAVTESSVVTPRVRTLMGVSLKTHLVKLVQDKNKYDAAILASVASMDGVASEWQAKKRKAVEAAATEA